MKKIILCLLLVVGLLLPSFAAATSLIIPRKNHYIYQPSMWQRVTGAKVAIMVVETYMRNTNKDRSPVSVVARAEVVELKGGKLMPTGRTIPVEPKTAVLYPKNSQKFEIHWTIPDEDGSEIVFFSINARPDLKEVGFQITTGMGYHMIFSRAIDAKWVPRPYIDAEVSGVSIRNLDKVFAFEGHLLKYKDGAIIQGYKRHVFIPAGGVRYFAITDFDTLDGVLFDCGGFDKRVGTRIR